MLNKNLWEYLRLGSEYKNKIKTDQIEQKLNQKSMLNNRLQSHKLQKIESKL